MDYNARFYSPTLGRFTQPDNIIPGMANSQNWNRYIYTRNNPINFNDPSGHVTYDGSGDGCKAPTKVDPTSSPIKINLPPPGGGGPKNDDDHPHDVGEKKEPKGYIYIPILTMPNINIPIKEAEACVGMKEFFRNCVYGSTDATLKFLPNSKVTFSPSTTGVTYGDYSFSPLKISYGDNSISSNGDLTAWFPLSATDKYSARFGATINFDTIKIALEASGKLDNRFAQGNFTVGLNSQIRPTNLAFAAIGTVVIAGGSIIISSAPQVVPPIIPVVKEGYCRLSQSC